MPQIFTCTNCTQKRYVIQCASGHKWRNKDCLPNSKVLNRSKQLKTLSGPKESKGNASLGYCYPAISGKDGRLSLNRGNIRFSFRDNNLVLLNNYWWPKLSNCQLKVSFVILKAEKKNATSINEWLWLILRHAMSGCQFQWTTQLFSFSVWIEKWHLSSSQVCGIRQGAWTHPLLT